MTFDSPLFGLNNSLAKLLLPKTVEVAPHLLPKNIEELIPDKLQIPIIQDFSVGVSTKWAQSQLRSLNFTTSKSDISHETCTEVELFESETNAPDENWTKYMTGTNITHAALTSIALAASIPYASSSYLVSHAENVRTYLEFVNPLLQPNSSHLKRLELLNINGDGVRVHHFVLDCAKGRFCSDFLVGNPEVCFI